MFVDIQIGVFDFAVELISIAKHNSTSSVLHQRRGGRAGFDHRAQRGKIAAEYRDTGLGLKGLRPGPDDLAIPAGSLGAVGPECPSINS